MYQLTPTILVEQTGQTIGGKQVKRLFDGALIPFDPNNVDYQEYLVWVAEGNEPLPADEPAQNSTHLGQNETNTNV
jgi:hypothetical protein